MKNDNIYAELKDFYSTKLETLLENYKTIGSDYTILGFDRNKAFVLSHKNGAMYLVEGADRVSRLDLNTDEYERRFKAAVRGFVEATLSDKPILTQSKKRELKEALDEQIYLFSLPLDGAVPLKESTRKKVFDHLMENQLFKEYLIKLGGRVKNNQTVIVEAIPYIGLRARDKLIKFLREQIELSYDQARTMAVALLNLAFGKQYNESLKAKNLYRSINSVLPPPKARELTYFILETAGKAMLNEFKVKEGSASAADKGTPIDAPEKGKVIVEPGDVGRVIDEEGKALEPGEYPVDESDEKEGASVSGPKGKHKHLKLLPEAKTYFKEAEDPNPEEMADIDEELPIEEDIVVNKEEELENALTILKRVFKEEVSELSESAEETFEENEKGFKSLMGSITSLEKYIDEIKAETEVEEAEEGEEATEIDEEPKTKRETPDVDLEDILAAEEEPKEKGEASIEDILDEPIEEADKPKGKGEPITEESKTDEGEAPDYTEGVFDEGEGEEKDLEVPDYTEGVFGEDEENPEEGDLEAPDYTEGVFGEGEEESSELKVVNLGDAFIFDSGDDIKDNEGVTLTPDEVYTVVAIDEDKKEAALANEKGVKSIVNVDELSKYNNYFSPVKSLAEGTMLEVFDDSILDDNGETLPIGEYELVQLDEEGDVAKISNMETNKLYTLDLDNLGNMGILKIPGENLAEPDSESDIPNEPEKTEYPEEAYDETASEIAQVVEPGEAPPYDEIKEDGEESVVEQVTSPDDKVEINIKIPADKLEGTKLEDLMFGLTDKQLKSNADENSDYLYKPTNESETAEEVIPARVLSNEDREVEQLYRDLLSLEKQISDYTEQNKQIYQMEDESVKYTALIDKMKQELETNPTDTVKQSVKDFLATVKEEEEEFVDSSSPAPAVDVGKEGE